MEWMAAEAATAYPHQLGSLWQWSEKLLVNPLRRINQLAAIPEHAVAGLHRDCADPLKALGAHR